MMSDLETIYRQYGKMIYGFLLSLSHDEHLAEELMQETMFRAVMNIDSFRGDSKISVWLCQIAKNLYYENAKKQRRFEPIDTMEQKDDASDVETRLEDKAAAHRILQILHTLEDPYKEVFMLHALGDVPLNKISALFGKSESWARVTYYRAKAMIASKLEGGR